MGTEGAANRVAVHLHGGKTPWVSDGVPHAWWDAQGNRGESFIPMTGLNPNLQPNEAELYYPNDQSARLMWYHDHALGTTQLNACAGLASAYILTDDYETTLTQAPVNLPGPAHERTMYLAFQEKSFVPANHAVSDPTWATIVPDTQPGDLWYPHVYEPARWAVAPGANELGWKETIRMNPGEVTRVLMKFELPSVPFTVPASPRTGGTGAEYVWHCHILEHEEHDMMRHFVVV